MSLECEKLRPIAYKCRTCVRSLMSFQMRTFRVDLFAAEELTFVYSALGIGTVVLLSLVIMFCLCYGIRHDCKRNGR